MVLGVAVNVAVSETVALEVFDGVSVASGSGVLVGLSAGIRGDWVEVGLGLRRGGQVGLGW
jgi:hypothetical protein